MKKLILPFLLTCFLASTVFAFPLTQGEKHSLQKQEKLKNQMDKMILSVADMDYMVNRDRELDFEILEEDATRILEAIKTIRELDKDKIFSKNLKELEKPTKKLLRYSQKQDQRANKYPEQIFNACFRCHDAHRKPNL